jgi:hypothetical protein
MYCRVRVTLQPTPSYFSMIDIVTFNGFGTICFVFFFGLCATLWFSFLVSCFFSVRDIFVIPEDFDSLYFQNDTEIDFDFDATT